MTLAVVLHVTAGTTWVLTSVAIAALGRLGRRLAIAQLAAAFLTLLAGIFLWHARHTGPQGPVEHLLTVGTFCAFVALGLQLPVAGPAAFRAGTHRLEAGALWVVRAGAVAVLGAALAMLGSLAV